VAGGKTTGLRVFFKGGFGKYGAQRWCFCGDVVVNCVVKRDPLTAAAAKRKISTSLKNIFHGAFERERGEDQLQTL
jgi:hypothetical protein